jgi:glycosyltransferase involved in cell wall biosynthesis
MSSVSLSYLLTTYNKLNYLRVTLPLLISAKKNDEEIVVVDGGSTDGTVDYLKQLFEQNKIQSFLSEKDKGEAQGLNKAVFLAKGTLLKIITDDDVFDFSVISKCKDFMLSRPDIDMMGYDGYSCKVAERHKFEKSNYLLSYTEWLKHRAAFLFCGLSFLFRKSSVSQMGLFHTGFKIIDMEYSLRISSMDTRIAFCTQAGFVNLVNPASNSVKFYLSLREEYKILRRTYPRAKINFRLNNPSLILKEKLNQLIRKNDRKIRVSESEILETYKKLVTQSLLKLQEQNPTSFSILAPQV